MNKPSISVRHVVLYLMQETSIGWPPSFTADSFGGGR